MEEEYRLRTMIKKQEKEDIRRKELIELLEMDKYSVHYEEIQFRKCKLTSEQIYERLIFEKLKRSLNMDTDDEDVNIFQPMFNSINYQNNSNNNHKYLDLPNDDLKYVERKKLTNDLINIQESMLLQDHKNLSQQTSLHQLNRIMILFIH